MDPKILKFIYLDGFVILLIVAYLYWRPHKGPNRLKLRQSLPSDKGQPVTEQAPERQLNVIFQFNGHDFEAYEVLGLAAGSPMDKVEAAYKLLIESSPPDTHEFYRIAFDAIRRS